MASNNPPKKLASSSEVLTSTDTEDDVGLPYTRSYDLIPLRHSTQVTFLRRDYPEITKKKTTALLDTAVLEWLKYIGMEQYAEHFARNGYDNIKVCGHLDESDIEALGLANVLPGHKKSLLVYSAELGELIASQRELRLKKLSEEPFTTSFNFQKTLLSNKQKNNSKIFSHDNNNNDRMETQIDLESVRKDTPKADKLEHAYLKQSSFQQRQEFVEWDKIELIEPAFQDQRIHIVLARHGLSQASIDNTIYTKMSDHIVPLAQAGEQQAKESGAALRKYYEEKFGEPDKKDPTKKVPPIDWHCRMWSSPYLRARQTATIMQEEANKGFKEGKGWITDMREHVLLAEQQFGLFEGIDWNSDELMRKYPTELEYYRKAERYGGRFWAKVPLGESRLDVAQRVHHSFHTFRRDAEAFGIDKIVIVSHGLTLRAFMMMWLNQRPEWLEAEQNPQSGSLRVIEQNGIDGGYIHPTTNPTESSRLDLLLTDEKRKVHY